MWGSYDIISTDYDNYAYVISVKKDSFFSIMDRQWFWVLTRQPLSTKSAEFKEVANKAREFFETTFPGYNFDEDMKETL